MTLQYTPGDILIWRRKARNGGLLLVKTEYVCRDGNGNLTVRLPTGGVRVLDPNELRRPVFTKSVPFSQIRNYQEVEHG